MASLSLRGRAHTLQFTLYGRRHTVSLGPLSAHDAQQVKLNIERLVATREAGLPPDAALVAWMARTSGRVRDALVKAGFAEADACVSVADYLDRHCARTSGRKALMAAAMREAWGALPLASLTTSDGREFMAAQSGNENTRRSKASAARTLLKTAIKRGWCHDPFEGLPLVPVETAARKRFVTTEEAERILDACPDAEFRLIVALSRFGGLRTPSEPLALTWQDFDWDRQRFTVTDVKRKQSRTVPLFPRLQQAAQEAFEAASVGQTHIVSRYRETKLSDVLKRAVRQAGLKPWRRPWHSMRASRETELMEEFPLHVVCEWIGNSGRVALKHYIRAQESHFKKAVAEAEAAASPPPPACSTPAADGRSH